MKRLCPAARCHVAAWLLLLPALVLANAGCTKESPVAPDAQLKKPEAVDTGPPLFEEVTEATGLRFAYRNGEEAGHYAILEELGGGIALLDYDGDGLLDVFVTGGGYFTGVDKQTIAGHPSKLFRNLGNWKFKDVTAEAGLATPLFYTHGTAVADYDRDGWPDLLVTGWGRLALYHNEPVDPTDPRKGRKFVELSRKAGLNDTRWSTGAAWADLDGDGYPDLYVCHYVDWSFKNDPNCKGYTADIAKDVCSPRLFTALPHVLYRNNRDGTFTDVSKSAGLRIEGVLADGKQVEMGKGLGVVIADLNGDRKPDVYVANDTVINFLYFNRGKMIFDEKGMDSGTAVDEQGTPNGSMGVDVGDYDGTGRASIFVTNYEGEMHALYRNEGNELFTFATTVSGISAIGQKYVGFGTAFVDVQSRGLLDVVIANGHVIRHPVKAGLRQKPVLLQNQHGGRFLAITPRGGPYFKSEHQARGLAVGDLDNDGRPDLVISHVNDNFAVLRNVAGDKGERAHWLGLSLEGKKHADVVGARVILEAGGKKQTRFVKGGGSYLSSSDPRLLFGLGKNESIERLTVEWPSGLDQSWQGKDLPVDRYWRLQEGQDSPQSR